jgi:hypothetical protein
LAPDNTAKLVVELTVHNGSDLPVWDCSVLVRDTSLEHEEIVHWPVWAPGDKQSYAVTIDLEPGTPDHQEFGVPVDLWFQDSSGRCWHRSSSALEPWRGKDLPPRRWGIAA